MSSDEPDDIGEPQVDLTSLHREDVFTDLGAASIRRLTPIRVDGSDDPARETQYIGETSLITQLGPVPVQFPLDATSLEDAFKKFPDGVKTAVELRGAAPGDRGDRGVAGGPRPAGGERAGQGRSPEGDPVR